MIKKGILSLGFLFSLLSLNAVSAQNEYNARYFDSRLEAKIEKLQNLNYEVSGKNSYLEKRIENLEKSNQELIKKNLELSKDLQREIEKQQILLRATNDNSNKNTSQAIETINGFNMALYNSQRTNFYALFVFLIFVVSLISYTLFSVRRMVRQAIEKENDDFIKHKVSEINHNFEKTLHTMISSAVDEAETKIKAATINIPGTVSKDSNLEIMINEGQEKLRNGKIEESLEIFNKVISLNRKKPDGYYQRGIVHLRSGNPEEAIADFDRAITLKPNMYEAHNQKGLALMKLSRYNDAKDCFDSAIKLNKSFVWAYNNKGLVLHSEKRFQESIEEFNRAIEIKNDFSNAYHNRAIAYLALNLNDNAVKDFTMAVEIDNGAAVQP